MDKPATSTWPVFSAEEVDAVAQVLSSGRVNYWTGGEGRAFESEFAEHTGVAHACLVANGTAALELAIGALHLPPGAEVITTPRTFIATSSAILRQGLVPVFADIDPDSGNITAESVERVITDKTAAIVVVHLGGWPADMAELASLSARYGLRIVEDCAQAHGASIHGKPVGSWGDIAAWSFCQDKIISTGGEGGMVTTDDRKLWQEVWEVKDHGKSWKQVHRTDHGPGFRWLHERPGTNLRATEMQAAIGRVQLRSLPRWNAVRNENATALAKGLSQCPVMRVSLPPEHMTHAFYRLNAYLVTDAMAPDWNQQRFLTAVGKSGGQIFSGSCSEIYREKALACVHVPRLPMAEHSTLTSLSFLVDPTLTPRDMELLAEIVCSVGEMASR